MTLLQLIPLEQARVWGGQTLRPGAHPPIGEAWVIYEGNRVAGGPYAGRTLAEVVAAEPAYWLGADALARTGMRFPLLIKLLDCADWLSIQVHPNDDQARRLAGPGQFGKTEAWHMLRVEPGAQLIAGVQAGLTADQLARAIRTGQVAEVVTYHTARAGDTFLMPAGTLHALGPGLFLYEVQQTSDLTYRVFDWNRPASAGRALHIEESVAVTDPQARGQVTPWQEPPPNTWHRLTACAYFTLYALHATQPVTHAPAGTLHALTVSAGQARVTCGADQVTLGPYESVVVAAGASAYTLEPLGTACRVLCAHP